MRYEMAVLECDVEDCGTWTPDDYKGLVSYVGETHITESERSPGWHSNRDGDFCPEHAASHRDDQR